MIDITFDFTTDSKGYWDGYWERGEGLGACGADPDKDSPTLRTYHQTLWSKPLPNGEVMQLEKGKWADYDYLTYKDMRFGSDAIIVDFRYHNYREIIDQIFEMKKDYKAYYEDLTRKSYTMGGMIIFPKHPSSMNQNKGTNRKISDRWDLTLECIRRHYKGEESPLSKTINKDKAFYDRFVDFKGYVDFFFLQDCVSEDYSKVDIWCGDAKFEGSGLPKTIDEYFEFIDKEYSFLEKRNERIKKYCLEKGI